MFIEQTVYLMRRHSYLILAATALQGRHCANGETEILPWASWRGRAKI